MPHSNILIKNYLLRLIKAIIASFHHDIHNTLISQLTDDVYAILIQSTSSRAPVGNSNNSQYISTLNTHKAYIIQLAGSTRLWDRLQQTFEELLMIKDRDELSRYLIQLDSMINTDDEQQQQQPFGRNFDTTTYPGQNHFRLSSSSSSNTPPPQQQQQQRSSSRNTTNNSFQFNNNNTLQGKPLSEYLIPFYYDTPNPNDGLISEPEIVKNLMFTLTGSTTDMFPFENRNSTHIRLPTNISFGTSGLLHKLFEPVLIYRKLNSLVINDPISLTRSQVEVAFLGCLKTELLSYINLVNGIYLNSSNLTLKSIHVKLLDEIIKLRFLNFLFDQLELLKPNEFLSLLYNYTIIGDSLLKEISIQFFKACVYPYYSMIQNWLIEGNLNIDDVKNENFFITFQNEKQQINCQFIPSNVPIFLKDSGELIYQIGKSLIFLKDYCDETEWCFTISNKYLNVFNNLSLSVITLFIKNLQMTIQLQYNDYLKYLNLIIFNKFKLLDEIKNLHSFLLMSKSDFINSLIDKGLESLNGSSINLSSHQLMKILQESVENSSVRHRSKNTINRLDARILEINHGNTGWDVFTLDYQIESPMNLILNENHMKEYLRMFNFLLKFQKIEYLLNSSWLESNCLKKKPLKLIERQISFQVKSNRPTNKKRLFILKTFKRLNILRNEFIKFIKIVKNFFDLEIIEKNYNKLLRKFEKRDLFEVTKTNKNLKMLINNRIPIDTSTIDVNLLVNGVNQLESYFTIDELKEIHYEYIKSITRSKIFEMGNESNRYHYIEQINTFIEIINRFVSLNEEFNNLLLDVLSSKEEHQSDDVDGGDWNKLVDDLQVEIIESFEDKLVGFTNDLICDKDESLRRLGVMLSN